MVKVYVFGRLIDIATSPVRMRIPARVMYNTELQCIINPLSEYLFSNHLCLVVTKCLFFQMITFLILPINPLEFDRKRIKRGKRFIIARKWRVLNLHTLMHKGNHMKCRYVRMYILGIAQIRLPAIKSKSTHLWDAIRFWVIPVMFHVKLLLSGERHRP